MVGKESCKSLFQRDATTLRKLIGPHPIRPSPLVLPIKLAGATATYAPWQSLPYVRQLPMAQAFLAYLQQIRVFAANHFLKRIP